MVSALDSGASAPGSRAGDLFSTENQVQNIWLTPQIARPAIIAILLTLLHVFLLITLGDIWFLVKVH